MEGLDRIDGIFRRQWKAMEGNGEGWNVCRGKGGVDGGGLGGLVRAFGKEVLGRYCESWADDCASDEQSALNNSYHSVHSVLVERVPEG